MSCWQLEIGQDGAFPPYKLANAPYWSGCETFSVQLGNVTTRAGPPGALPQRCLWGSAPGRHILSQPHISATVLACAAHRDSQPAPRPARPAPEGPARSQDREPVSNQKFPCAGTEAEPPAGVSSCWAAHAPRGVPGAEEWHLPCKGEPPDTVFASWGLRSQPALLPVTAPKPQGTAPSSMGREVPVKVLGSSLSWVVLQQPGAPTQWLCCVCGWRSCPISCSPRARKPQAVRRGHPA